MKIDKIDFYPVSVPYKLIEKSSRVYRSGVTDIIVKITTDDGIIGWGEATRTASARVILESLEAMKPVLINKDPWQNLRHEKTGGELDGRGELSSGRPSPSYETFTDTQLFPPPPC